MVRLVVILVRYLFDLKYRKYTKYENLVFYAFTVLQLTSLLLFMGVVYQLILIFVMYIS